ncbi:hypothetical protein CB1_000287033 [Camelus ferus]|nr:hypothetical protein CB1_000287033 [Camelus ferus]
MGDRGGQWPDVAEHVPEAMGDQGATRISVAEMKSYYIYCEWCSWLLSAAEGVCYDEIMHQDISPLCAADIQDQLQKCFAYLSGGRGQDGSPVITFPDYPAFGEVPDKEFQNVMTYLTSVPSLQDAGIGFILVIDRRQDKWTSVKASVLRIAVLLCWSAHTLPHSAAPQSLLSPPPGSVPSLFAHGGPLQPAAALSVFSWPAPSPGPM